MGKGKLDPSTELLLIQLFRFLMVAHCPWGRVKGFHDESLIPVYLAYALAQALPHCVATFYPYEGHLSTPGNHAEDILKTLCS